MAAAAPRRRESTGGICVFQKVGSTGSDTGSWRRWRCSRKPCSLPLPGGSGRRNTRPGSRTAANDSCFHQPDLIATPVGLHGRVVPGAEVDVAPAAGRALQGGTQLGGVGYVVGFLGVTPKLPEVEESKALVKRRRDL